MFGLDVLGWAVVAGVAAVVSVIAAIVMPFISDAILNRRHVVVTFGKVPYHGDMTFTVEILSRGRSWIRIEKSPQLWVWDARQRTRVLITDLFAPPMLVGVWGGTLHTGDSELTEFDGRAVATRLSEMGNTGTQFVYGEYVDRDEKIFRTKTTLPIPVDEWKHAER